MDLSSPLHVALAILGISLLVVIHEAGHYLAARAVGMRVLKFSIGLGPALWKHQKDDSPTVYQVCAIPLLAYVQIDGMNPTEVIDPKDDELYANKGVLARILVIFAGPLANYLAAAAMVFVLCLTAGYPTGQRSTAIASAVMEDTPAAAAGIEPGDRVVEVEGEAIADGEALQAAHEGRGGVETHYVIERDGERMPITLTPRLVDGRAIMGISLQQETILEVTTVDVAWQRAFEAPLRITILTFAAIRDLIEKPDAEKVQSAVGMTKILADELSLSPQRFFYMLVQLSVALGLFNLLPFPALDGGRLTFLGYELITRRRTNEKVEAVVHTVGLLFLLGVLVLVMGKDILNLAS